MTGQIGQVMQESMQAALTWVRSNAAHLGIAEDFFADHDIHMHVPAGAIPKDGPSAGVTMATTLVSLLSGHHIRPLTAMTGEITLSGNVLPVGGIKEKVLAAKRAGITTVILPAENKMNVEEDLTPEQLGNLSIHYVKTIGEALRVSLPVVAESLAAKSILTPPKEPKSEQAPIQPVQGPVVAHDKVVTWQS
jgi:ATP-dependent Lon protease